MRWWLAVWVLACTACGRIGFEPRQDGATSSEGPAETSGGLGSGFGTFAGGKAGAGHIVDFPGGGFVIAGSYTASMQFGDVMLPTFGGQDVFLVRVDAQGQVMWAQGFGSPGDEIANAVAVDASGNAYFVGSMTGPVDFGGGPIAPQFDDGFVASFSPSGAHRWSHAVGGSVPTGQYGNDTIVAVAAGPDGIVIGGGVVGAVDFGGQVLQPTGGASDSFTAGYTSDGNLRWAHRYGVSGYNLVFDIAIDQASGNVYASAYYEGTPDFGGGAVTYRGIQDAVVLAYSGNGGFRWSRDFGGSGFDWLYGLAVDPAGDVYIGGWFESSIVLGSTLTSAGMRDGLLASYSSAGTLRWARSIGGTECDYVNELHPVSGSMIAVGRFSGSVDLGMGVVTSNGPNDGFGLVLDTATGATSAAFQYGTAAGDNVEDVAGPDRASLVFTGYTSGLPGAACDSSARTQSDAFILPRSL